MLGRWPRGLVLSRRGRTVGIEVNANSAPTVTRGFWTAVADLGLREVYVVAPVRESFPLGQGVEAISLGGLLERLDGAAG